MDNKEVLTREEVRRLIESDQNPKIRLMLILAYSAGLTIEEIQALKPGDIDFNRKAVHIKKGIDNSGRTVDLSQNILDLVKPYIEIYRPTARLFPGGDSVSEITEGAVRNIFRDAMLKAGIKKDAGIEILRRSISAHLMESGASKEEIRRLLGDRIKTV